MEGIAFVVGVSHYQDQNLNDLNCPVKDAGDMAEALRRLRYKVIDSYDDPKDIVDDKWNDFKSEILSKGYDTSIVFFSGHGMHVNDSACLLLSDAKAKTHPEDTRAKAKSLLLKDLMEDLDKLELPVKIFIIDACRTLSRSKGIGVTPGIKLTEISKQTFIAYATAFGEPANDGGEGENSAFTGALLKDLEEENLPIEQLFKRVRLRLIEKSLDQTPWEHTCLVADFAFNHGQLSKYYKAPFSEAAFKNIDYKAKNDLEEEILEGIQYGGTNGVKRGIDLIGQNFKDLSPEFKFVAGRLISEYASRGNSDCLSLINNVRKIKVLDGNGNNSMLKGILYNLYFDDTDSLRQRLSANTGYLNTIEKLREISGDRDAENFVIHYLGDDASRFLYLTGSDDTIQVIVDQEETGAEYEDGRNIKVIKSIEVPYHGIEVDIFSLDTIAGRDAVRKHVATSLRIPVQIMRINLPDDGLYTTFDFESLEQHINEEIAHITVDEIDILSSNSYIESVGDISRLTMTKEDESYHIGGECTLTVHMEFDHETMQPMTFPSQFSVHLLRTDNVYHLHDLTFRPDTSAYYL